MKPVVALLLLSLPAEAQTIQPMDPPSPMLLQCLVANKTLWAYNQTLIGEIERLREMPPPKPVKVKPKRLPCKKGRTRKNGVCGRW